MNKILKIIIPISLISFILISIFWKADLRTTEIKNNSQPIDKVNYAKQLLNEAIIKQGLDKINKFSTYEIVCKDNWKGMMGKMGNPWNWNNYQMHMLFTIGDFDGQVKMREGIDKEFVAGIQSWDYYEKENNAYNTEVDNNKGIMFTLAAYHYFAELGNRLKNAPFIRYAGQDKLNGKTMEKVFVSWGNNKTSDYDHYILWIGKESKLIEATTFTTRDNPMPAPAFLYGSLRFDDFRKVNGIMIPFLQTAQLMNPKDDLNNFIHQLTIQSFEWDSFNPNAIRPFTDLQQIGDAKK